MTDIPRRPKRSYSAWRALGPLASELIILRGLAAIGQGRFARAREVFAAVLAAAILGMV
jgi:hypothetical protein